MTKRESNPPHWTADFVEHLRTVNFALLGVCLTLLGVIQLQRPSDVVVAQAQFQEIKSLVDKWDTNQFVATVIDGLLQKDINTSYIPQNNKLENAFLIHAENCVLADAVGMLMPVNSTSSLVVSIQEAGAAVFKRPVSLRDFRQIWDHKEIILSFRVQNRGGDKFVLIKEDGSIERAEYTLGSVEFTEGHFHVGEISLLDVKLRQAVADLMKIAKPTFAISWKVGQDTVLFLGAVEETPLNNQTLLLQDHSYWKPGEFAAAFSALDKATGGIQDDSFESIAVKLQEKASKPKSEEFEVFGVKFPVDKASRWGILLIVAIQLYLWIHLHELSPRLKLDDAGWDVAWIGVYQSLPAKVLFVSSTVLMPIVTIGALGNIALRDATVWIWCIYIGSMLASLILGVLIVRTAPRRGSRK